MQFKQEVRNLCGLLKGHAYLVVGLSKLRTAYNQDFARVEWLDVVSRNTLRAESTVLVKLDTPWKSYQESVNSWANEVKLHFTDRCAPLVLGAVPSPRCPSPVFRVSTRLLTLNIPRHWLLRLRLFTDVWLCEWTVTDSWLCAILLRDDREQVRPAAHERR